MDSDAKSIISMQELDPSPVDDSTSDLDTLESGEYTPKPIEEPKHRTCGLSSTLGLRPHRWDALCTSSPNEEAQNYKTTNKDAIF
jgi:tRNA (guanine26-N2/guanine27-N2)-dimethyltransferase